MSRDRIHGRNHLVGSGAMNHPDRLEELEEIRAKHERVTRGKPAKAFGELLDEKLKQRSKGQGEDKEEKEGEEPEEKGAKDPLLGLSVAQAPAIANRGKGRRSGKVIVKG